LKEARRRGASGSRGILHFLLPGYRHRIIETNLRTLHEAARVIQRLVEVTSSEDAGSARGVCAAVIAKAAAGAVAMRARRSMVCGDDGTLVYDQKQGKLRRRNASAAIKAGSWLEKSSLRFSRLFKRRFRGVWGRFGGKRQ